LSKLRLALSEIALRLRCTAPLSRAIAPLALQWFHLTNSYIATSDRGTRCQNTQEYDHLAKPARAYTQSLFSALLFSLLLASIAAATLIYLISKFNDHEKNFIVFPGPYACRHGKCPVFP
jgi:hypothetical protein